MSGANESANSPLPIWAAHHDNGCCGDVSWCLSEGKLTVTLQDECLDGAWVMQLGSEGRLRMLRDALCDMYGAPRP